MGRAHSALETSFESFRTGSDLAQGERYPSPLRGRWLRRDSIPFSLRERVWQAADSLLRRISDLAGPRDDSKLSLGVTSKRLGFVDCAGWVGGVV